MGIDIGAVTENDAIAGGDGGRSMANLIYILYIIGFFTGFTALVGVILAYVNRGPSTGIYRSHLTFQIKIFWRGVIFLVAAFVLYLVTMLVGVFTAGLGFILVLLPLALGIWWLVWTIIAIAKGMGALGRREAI